MFTGVTKSQFSILPRILHDANGAGALGHDTNPSWSHTIGASYIGKTLLVVGIATVTSTPSAVEVGSTPLTQLGSTYTFSTGHLTLWYLFSPPTGSQTIAVTSASAYTAAGSVSYLNVGGYATATGASNNTSTTAITETIWSGQPPAGSLTIGLFASSHAGGSFTAGIGFATRFNGTYTASTNYAFLIEDIFNTNGSITATPPGSGDTAWLGAGFTPVSL